MKKQDEEVQLTFRVDAEFYARWQWALTADDRKQTQILRKISREWVESIEAQHKKKGGS